MVMAAVPAAPVSPALPDLVPSWSLGELAGPAGEVPRSPDAADPLDPTHVVRRLAARPADAWTSVELAALDPADLAPEDLPFYLRACAAAEAHAAARRLAAVRLVADAAGGPDEVVDTGPYDVAIALRVPLGSAVAQVRHARRLATHLPATEAALSGGEISYPHALRVLEATSGVTDPAAARAVEQVALRRAARSTPGELAGAARRAVATLDPDGFARRHEAAARGSEVELTPDEDAMAWLSARMPLVDAVVVKSAVDAYARGKKATGDPRPLGVLRAEALRVFAERYLTGSGEAGPDESGTGRPREHGRPVEVQLVAPLETWLGLADTPGELPGFGPVPAEMVRAISRDAGLRRLITDPATGHLLDYGRRAYRAPADLAAFVLARHRRGAAPGTSVTQAVDLDHTVAFPEGPTAPGNLTPQTRAWHRGRTLGGLTTSQAPDGRLTWRTRLGQRADVEPYDYRLGP